MNISADFPGGNIVFEKQDGHTVYVHQDIRDTSTPWFYWYFSVPQPEPGTYVFQFTQSPCFTQRGPGVSLDRGRTWQWLGQADLEQNLFEYTFTGKEAEVRFSFGQPYLQYHLDAFLAHHPTIRKDALCTSSKGRPVEKLTLGNPNAAKKLLFSARHHCCEMMANHVLEGVIEEAMALPHALAQTELVVIPFMDKDGSEDGDQGKNRSPHDHNRDYNQTSIYPEVKAAKSYIETWSKNAELYVTDIHCPHIRDHNIFQVGSNQPHIWQAQQNFAGVLASHIKGPLPYLPENDLAFGREWNSPKSFGKNVSSTHWASSLPQTRFATCLEVPYALVGEVTVTPDAARAFGRDFVRALVQFSALPQEH